MPSPLESTRCVPQGAVSSEPCGLSCMALVPGAPLCPEASVRDQLVRAQRPPGLLLNEKALNPFPALAPELLVWFLQLLGEL